MEEIWKDIKGYEGLYRISNTGKVFGIRRGKNKKCTKNTNNTGFTSYIVGLSKNSVQKVYQLHILLYKTFKGDIQGMIEFKDGNSDNLFIDNLIDVDKTYKFKKNHCIRVLDTRNNKLYSSISELSKELNLLSSNLAYFLHNNKKGYEHYKLID